MTAREWQADLSKVLRFKGLAFPSTAETFFGRPFS